MRKAFKQLAVEGESVVMQIQLIIVPNREGKKCAIQVKGARRSEATVCEVYNSRITLRAFLTGSPSSLVPLAGRKVGRAC